MRPAPQAPSDPTRPAPYFVAPSGCLARDDPPDLTSLGLTDRAESLLVRLVAGPAPSRRAAGWTTRVAAAQQVSVGAVVDDTLELVVPAAETGDQPRDEWWTAQLVHTAVSLPGISVVRFATPDGQAVQVPVQGSALASSEVRVDMVAPTCD